MATAVINQRTERVIRGVVTNTVDALGFTALEIVRVGNSPQTTDYTPTTDFKLTSGEVDWSPTGREPASGANYYVTYKYQPPSSFKDFDTVTTEMEIDINALQPDADVKAGTVARNLFIDVPGRQNVDIFATAERIAATQSLKNVDRFEGTELDDYAYNFSEVRLSSTYSSGYAMFSASAVVAEPIVIPSGTRVSTLATSTQNSVYFRTTTDATISPGESSVLAPVQAESAGLNGNVGSNTITIVNTPILGIQAVSNPSPTAGGRDQESDADFANRIRQLFLATDRTTYSGIRRQALAFDNVIDALVVGAGNSLLTRDGGTGGKVDVYIQAETGYGREVGPEDYTYDGSDIVLNLQPVLGITEVQINGTPTSSYGLIKDIGALVESTRALDSVRILGGASPGDIITITYDYNGLLNDIQDEMDSETSAPPARDLLVRSASVVFIDVSVAVSPLSGYDFAAVQTGVVNAVGEYINALTLGALISYKDVFDRISAVAGVQDVRPLSLLSRRGEGTAESVQLRASEYPAAGTISVERA